METTGRHEDVTERESDGMKTQTQITGSHRYQSHYQDSIMPHMMSQKGQDTEPGSTESHNPSPPPHLSATNTVTTSTPTSTETTSSSSDNDRPQASCTISAATSDYARESMNSSVPAAVGSDTNTNTTVRNPLSSQEHSWNHHTNQIQHHHQSDSDDYGETDAQYSTDSRYAAPSSSFPSAIKLLVSNNVAGSIIGRSGQTISDLQSKSGTRIKLSQTGDYYPGTQDRVCLVQGQPENVKKATSFLLTRLFALQQQQHYHHFAWHRQHHERGLFTPDPMFGMHDPGHPTLVPGFSFVVRVLVPAPCCGMIIGKGGTNIKQMVDNSGVASVRLSPKEGGGSDVPGTYPVTPSPAAAAALVSATSERVVTITGPDLNSCLKCMYIILDGMSSHLDISRYANMTTSYSRVMSAAQNAFTGTQSAAVPSSTSARVPMGDVGRQEGMESIFPQQSHQPLQDNLGSNNDSTVAHAVYTEQDSSHQTVNVPPAPPSPQVRSGLPFAPLVGGTAPFLPPESSSSRTSNPSLYMMPPVSQTSMQGTHETLAHGSSSDRLAHQMENSLHVSEPTAAAEGPLASYPPSGTQFAPQMPQPTHQPPGFVAQIAVPDSIIGSILGRGGRTLNELQALSGTRIRISQRGEYLPGTRNRVVTIRGQNAQSVTTAQFFMSQRMVLPPTAAYIPQENSRPEFGMMYSSETVFLGPQTTPEIHDSQQSPS